ncbi:hypothetical protein D3C80_1833300 [compost metagenome]
MAFNTLIDGVQERFILCAPQRHSRIAGVLGQKRSLGFKNFRYVPRGRVQEHCWYVNTVLTLQGIQSKGGNVKAGRYAFKKPVVMNVRACVNVLP